MIKAVGRKTVAFALIVVTFLVVIVAIGGMQGLGATKAADLTPGPNIGQTVHAVYAWNGTTWVNTGFTNDNTSISVSTPAGFAVKQIVIIQDNPTYDMHGLLNTSNFYNKVNIGLAAADVHNSTTKTAVHTINLTSAYFIIGNIVNGTNMHSIGSKGFSDIAGENVLYDSSINRLNTSYEIGLFPMVEALNEQSGFAINLNDTSANSTNVVTLSFTQQFQHPFNVNVLTIIEGITGAMLMIDVFALFASESYHYARRMRG